MKKVNKVLLFSILLASMSGLSSIQVNANERPSLPELNDWEGWGKIAAKSKDVCGKEDDREYYVKSYDENYGTCLIKKEYLDYYDINKSRQSKSGMYFTTLNVSTASTLPFSLAHDYRNQSNNYGQEPNNLELAHYVSTEDIGKEIEVEIYTTGVSLFIPSPFNSLVSSVEYTEIQPYTPIGISSEFKTVNQNVLTHETENIKDEKGRFVNSETIKFTLDSDSPFISFLTGIRFLFDNPTPWKYEDNPIKNSTAELRAKVKVGGEQRFDGPVMALIYYSDEDENNPAYKKAIDAFNNSNVGGLMVGESPEYGKTPDVKAISQAVQWFDEVYYPDRTGRADQNIAANVLNGGITGGIVSPEVGQDLSIKDVDFGKLSIGQVIEPIKEDSMVSVRDWTGGNGWKLTAQHKEADRNQSLQLGVQVNENAKVDLNNEAQPVTSGESQLDVTTQGGTYTAEWGTHPTVGEFNNVIEWNLSANVTE